MMSQALGRLLRQATGVPDHGPSPSWLHGRGMGAAASATAAGHFARITGFSSRKQPEEHAGTTEDTGRINAAASRAESSGMEALGRMFDAAVHGLADKLSQARSKVAGAAESAQAMGGRVSDSVDNAAIRAEDALDHSIESMKGSARAMGQKVVDSAQVAKERAESVVAEAKGVAHGAAATVAHAAQGAMHNAKAAKGLDMPDGRGGEQVDVQENVLNDPFFKSDEAQRLEAAKMGARSGGPGAGGAL